MKFFVSSPTRDLGEVRKKVCDYLVELKILPVSMDFYASGPQSPKDRDDAEVKDCDAFIILVGHLYGSSPANENKSFTELEYEAAIASGKPVYAFFASDQFPPDPSLRERDQANEKLQHFRDRLRKERSPRFFNNPDHLCAEVAAACFHGLNPQLCHRHRSHDKDPDKHLSLTLRLIEGVVNRMAGNSLHLKGWSVVLVSALFALAGAEANVNFVYLAYLPAIAFWILDGYFLRQERMYRKLYDAVRKETGDHDFSMDASWLATCASANLMTFHGMVFAAIVIVTLFTYAAK